LEAKLFGELRAVRGGLEANAENVCPADDAVLDGHGEALEAARSEGVQHVESDERMIPFEA
jgi:hypothetical protein